MSGTLDIGEHHPAAHSAMAYLRPLLSDPLRVTVLLECFASTALAGNRAAEVCLETLNLMLAGKGVGERYLLGLAWTVREMDLLGGKPKTKILTRKERQNAEL